MVNTSGQDFAEDSDVMKIVKTNQRRGVMAFEKTVKRAQAEGDIDASIEPKAVSRTICAAVNGMLSMSRAGLSPAFRDDVFVTLPGLLGIE